MTTRMTAQRLARLIAAGDADAVAAAVVGTLLAVRRDVS